MRDRRSRTRTTTAHALRELIRAELAHERAATADETRTAELEKQVSEARDHYRRLAGSDA